MRSSNTDLAGPPSFASARFPCVDGVSCVSRPRAVGSPAVLGPAADCRPSAAADIKVDDRVDSVSAARPTLRSFASCCAGVVAGEPPEERTGATDPGASRDPGGPCWTRPDDSSDRGVGGEMPRVRSAEPGCDDVRSKPAASVWASGKPLSGPLHPGPTPFAS